MTIKFIIKLIINFITCLITFNEYFQTLYYNFVRIDYRTTILSSHRRERMEPNRAKSNDVKYSRDD